MKKNSFGILERFPTKCTKYFFPFSFSFSIENLIYNLDHFDQSDPLKLIDEICSRRDGQIWYTK